MNHRPAAFPQPTRHARKRTVAKFLFAAMIAIGVAGCATGAIVRSERDPDAGFSAYRTFGFFAVLGTDRGGYETLVTRTLKASVRREMEARGYRFVPANGELMVNFNASLVDRTEFYPRPIPITEYYTYRDYASWHSYAVDVDQYKEGTLNIDIVDASRNQLVWEGIAIGRVTEKTYKNREEAIDKAVRDIFAEYPIPAPASP